MRRHAGFTLIELIIATAIVAVLAGVATRTYGAYMAAARSEHARAVLHNALVTAQRDSVVYNKHIVLCASRDAIRCSGSNQWETGWIAFIDTNRDREHQSEEMVVRQEGPAMEGVRVRSSSNRLRLVFQPNGGAAAGSNVTFVICDDRGPSKASALVLANSGRIRRDTPAPAQAESACR